MFDETALWRAVIAQALLDASTGWKPKFKPFDKWVSGRRKRQKRLKRPMESENLERAAYKYYIAAMELKDRQQNQVRWEADAWLSGKSKDFYLVCDYAGLEPESVMREHKRRKIDQQHIEAAE